MDWLKALLVKWGTPYLSKIFIRLIGYGTAAAVAKLGVDQSEVGNDWQAGLANFLTAVGIAGVTALIDWLQHRNDTVPAALSQDAMTAKLQADVEALRNALPPTP